MSSVSRGTLGVVSGGSLSDSDSQASADSSACDGAACVGAKGVGEVGDYSGNILSGVCGSDSFLRRLDGGLCNSARPRAWRSALYSFKCLTVL